MTLKMAVSMPFDGLWYYLIALMTEVLMGVNEWFFVAKRWYRWFFNLVASRTSMMDPQDSFMLRTTSG